MNPSLVGVGAAIITILNFILPLFDIHVDRGSLEQSILGLLNFLGFLALIWGQIRRKDTKLFIFKK